MRREFPVSVLTSFSFRVRRRFIVILVSLQDELDADIRVVMLHLPD
jgi:hypothetical protein